MKKFILSLILALLMAGNVFAATISKSFTSTGAGGDLSVKVGDSFAYAVSGTFSGTVVLQKSTNYFTWDTVVTSTGSASGTVIAESNNADQVHYRFFCTEYTSGTIVTTMTDATGYNEPVQEFKNKNGKVIAYTTENGMVVQDLTITGTQTGGGTSDWTTDSSSKTTTTYNVGIGTVNPTEALEVVGNLVVSGSITALGSENMGIGTTLPSQKLEVVGTVRTTGLNVGIGTTVAQQLCRKSTGEIGYFNGAWASTCN